MKSKITTSLLFLFFAIPGALMFVFSSMIVVLGIWDSTVWLRFDQLLIVGLTIAGAFLTLIGVEKVKQWLYIFVFLSFPFGFYLVGLIDRMTEKRPPLIFFLTSTLAMFGIPIVIYRYVKKYYLNQISEEK
jgi:hypothetical protein